MATTAARYVTQRQETLQRTETAVEVEVGSGWARSDWDKEGETER